MAHAREIRDLTCDDSFRSAAGKIIWTRFEEMMSFQATALAGEDIEGVHDMRVASRRLRAAVELFRDVFPRRELRPLLRRVKEIADALGEVRDTDVLLDRLRRDMAGRDAPQRLVLQDLIAELERDRERARRTLKSTLGDLEDTGFSRTFLSFVAREAM
jgi:CHAD domain-containing protein